MHNGDGRPTSCSPGIGAPWMLCHAEMDSTCECDIEMAEHEI